MLVRLMKTGRPSRLRAWLTLAAAGAGLAVAVPATASEPSNTGAFELSAPLQPAPDFRFAAPSMSFGIFGGWTFNRADGEIYDFMTELLTLEKSDFNAATFGANFGWRISSRADIVIGFEHSRRTVRSEYRDFVDQDGIPIVQDTRLTQVPLTVSLKFYLTPRGRAVGQYAWVPATVVPYIGGGGGGTWYRLEQFGEFVDFLDLAIFEDVFISDGWTFAAHAFLGLDIKLNPSLGLTLEGRYQWASADLRGNFIGFEPIDLNGLRALIGVNWKF